MEHKERPSHGINLLILLLALFVIAGCSSSTQHQPTTLSTPQSLQYETLIHLYDYDQHAPLDIQEKGVEDRGGIKIHDISFASPKGGRVTAYLVVPPGRGPFAGMLFMHEDGADRSSFLLEALRIATKGVISLMIDYPSVQSQEQQGLHPQPFHFTKQDREDFVRNVIELRRAVDVLLAQPDVDAHRIGFAGFSTGADAGAILAGVEKRIKAYTLWSGEAELTTFLRANAPLSGTELTSYLAAMEPLNAIHYIGHAAPSALLFQDGRADEYTSQQQLELLYQTASNPKQIKWYDAGHALNSDAPVDRDQWLSMQLGLKGQS
jgi:dienelactone hydrolase